MERISVLYGEVNSRREKINTGNVSDEEKAQLETEITERSKEIAEKEGANAALDAQIAQVSAQIQTGSQQAYAQIQQEVPPLPYN